MQLSVWTKCRKPVITAFCLYYGFFTITQSLPNRWALTTFCRGLIPEIFENLGLNYRLVLFGTQRKEVFSYFYRIRYQNGAVVNWTYPGPEFMLDKQLYARIFSNFMNAVKRSEQFRIDTARYVVRKFDTPDNHPAQIECVAIVTTIPAVGMKPTPASARTLFTYAVTPQDLAADAGAATDSQGPLDR